MKKEQYVIIKNTKDKVIFEVNGKEEAWLDKKSYGYNEEQIDYQIGVLCKSFFSGYTEIFDRRKHQGAI